MAHDVDSFARRIASASQYKDDCWHCGGQRTVRKVTGKAIKCGECKGTGKDNGNAEREEASA